jgi:predicted regulator of Ras-like GTPase activity (Roadblock/LC7/MglB family)
MQQTAHNREQEGFVGAVSGMTLADILQVKGNNRYSGCLAIEHLGKSGMNFLREGEVVHAEQGALSGEEAFYSIMGWTGGTFRTEANLASISRTINQAMSFLLLEAFRLMDESKNRSQSTPQAVAISGKEGAGVSDINVRLKAIPDVEQALIITKDGIVVADTSYEAEYLGAHALYLSIFAGQIGAQFGLGDVKSVTVHGSEHHVILYDSKRHILCVSAKGSSNVNAVDGEVRRVLAQK